MACFRRLSCLWLAVVLATTHPIAVSSSNGGPARVSCNAAYSLPCARINSEWLATRTSQQQTLLSDAAVIEQINKQMFNYETGFYPFVFDKITAECIAHGWNQGFVGKTLSRILEESGIPFADASALHQRFVAAADRGGDWVQYLWSDNRNTVHNKVAFVTNFTGNYYLGVGYQDSPLPPELPCSDATDAWCSINNVRSLIGKAQFALSQAATMAQFEATVLDISFDSDAYQMPGGFYLFLYNYDSTLKAHGVLHDYFGLTLPEVFEQLGRSEDGEALHQAFVRAADGQGSGWVQYLWSPSADEPEFLKIAYLVKIAFQGENYYLGAGFNHIMSDIVPAPLGVNLCSDKYNLLCAYDTTLQLTSHTLAFAVSSPDSVQNVFASITSSDDFRRGDFYAFVYDFNGTCVVHGTQAGFVGKTLAEVFSMTSIPLNAEKLHSQFQTAAESGGGWARYEWVKPGVEGSNFDKITYLFHVNRDGRDYYGGVGYNHERAPVEQYLEKGTKVNGSPIPCTSEYGTNCSEVNAQALLGQALSALVLASTKDDPATFEALLDYISNPNQNSTYRVNNFYVVVFKADCRDNEGNQILSGCCVAHSGNKTLVGMTWQQILDLERITSIQGSDLHNEILGQGKGFVEYPWSQDFGEARTKRALVSTFENKGDKYYAAVEYFKTPPPPTCDACPSGMECTRDQQDFCTEIPPTPFTKTAAFAAMMAIILGGIPALILFFVMRKRRSKRKYQTRILDKERQHKEEMEQMAKQMQEQMQGMVKICVDMPPISAFPRGPTCPQDPTWWHDEPSDHDEIRTLDNDLGKMCRWCDKCKQWSTTHNTEEHEGPDKSSGQKKTVTDNKGVWYWQEDDHRIDQHKVNMVLSGTDFVKYADHVSEDLERKYQRWKEGRGPSVVNLDLTNKISSTTDGQKLSNTQTGLQYTIDFQTMQQNNAVSDFSRAIHREETQVQVKIDASISNNLPLIPDDLQIEHGVDSEEEETFLPAIKNQMVQISKVHSGDEWLYGNVLFDPLLMDAQKQRNNLGTSGLNNMLSQALHDRPMSGWFPRSITEPANANDMSELLGTLGGEGMDSLNPPSTWERAESSSTSYSQGRFTVPKGSTEYDQVATYFNQQLLDMQNRVKLEGIERIQNLPLWQTYAVKKQTVKIHFEDSSTVWINNSGEIERKWLFGKQGFNRAFAGRNAVAYGKGVYFARDASYSSSRTYSAPDASGVQRMFLCRVVVGDWCKGKNGVLTPDPKPHNSLELFDCTVNNVHNPSIFVVYHDAQAYPEYLVSFRRT